MLPAVMLCEDFAIFLCEKCGKQVGVEDFANVSGFQKKPAYFFIIINHLILNMQEKWIIQ